MNQLHVKKKEATSILYPKSSFTNMGVWGLLSFIQMSNPPIGQQVSLSDMARKVTSSRTREHEGAPGKTSSQASAAPTLIVDGYALAHHLFFQVTECCWWDGGEMRDYSKFVRDWVREVQSSGLKLRCVLDGMMEPSKEATAVQRVGIPHLMNHMRITSHVKLPAWRFT